jgi:hypothetical protein
VHGRSPSVIVGEHIEICGGPYNSAQDEEKRALLVKKKPQQQAQPTYDKQHQRGRKIHFKHPQLHLNSIGHVAARSFWNNAWEHCLINAVIVQVDFGLPAKPNPQRIAFFCSPATDQRLFAIGTPVTL